MNNPIKNILLLLIFVILSLDISAQKCNLCQAVEKDDFKKVEEIIREKILERKYGDEIKNGSTIYTSYNKVYDELVIWLLQKECVELAAWDKCQIKILPYPSYSSFGAIFKTQNKQTEMTFHIREGHSSRLRNSLNSRERLYYLSMKESDGFVNNQISLCNTERENLRENDSLTANHLIKQDSISPSIIQKFNDTIDYKNLLHQYVCIDYKDTLTFKESGKPAVVIRMTRSARNNDWNEEIYSFLIVSEGKIKQIGSYSPWRIQIVGIQILQNGDLEAHFSGSYLFEENATTKLIYRKIINEK